MRTMLLLSSIPGGRKVIVHDLEIPDKHGCVPPNTSDTINPGGIMRALRTVPVFMYILDDMADVSLPGALLLNYSNLIAMNTWGMYDWIEKNEYDLHVVGLFHVTYNTAIMFRVWCGSVPSEFSYT